MELVDILKKAEKRIVIVGINPIAKELEESGELLANLLNLNRDLSITILYESDSECFQQSLLLDTPFSINRCSYDNMITHRNRISGPPHQSKAKHRLGLFERIEQSYSKLTKKDDLGQRVTIKQQNLQMPFCCVILDNDMLLAFVTNKMPTLMDYQPINQESTYYGQVLEYINFCTTDEKGGIYLSKPQEELIQLYDREGYPRGIYPRACFYTTSFKRYSIWGFVFNRRGELLLHQRSRFTKDGRGLWDKSTGGHVDLRDYSAFRTAQRELIEELFLPEAEFTKYMQAYLRDIVNFGVWNPFKREEASYIQAFLGLEPQDWVLFRATDENGELLTVDRVSQRRFHLSDDDVIFKETIFMSDVFFFIAPEGSLDTQEQMKNTFALSEKKGAAQSHKIIDLNKLRDWIADEKSKGKEREIFTDDLLFINDRYRGLLERFSEFVRFAFRRDS